MKWGLSVSGCTLASALSRSISGLENQFTVGQISTRAKMKRAAELSSLQSREERFMSVATSCRAPAPAPGCPMPGGAGGPISER